MKRIITILLSLLFVFLLIPFPASAGSTSFVRKLTPVMGWSSWNYYTTNVSEEIVLRQMKALDETGLHELGYEYINIDDGWQNGRENGIVIEKAQRWPNGMKYVADVLHENGYYAGIYSDGGDTTCGWYDDQYTTDKHVGLYGYEESDLTRYLNEWGYDFIKVDWCGGSSLELNIQKTYTNIGRIINKIEEETGKDKIFNVCCWHFPGDWVLDVADSWRTRGDISPDFESILAQIDNVETITDKTGKGHFNDLDMLEVGNGMTFDEDKSHFSMWCMFSAPLLIGTDVASVSDETLSILSNKELIALDQDEGCISAYLAKTVGSCQIWVKNLGSKDSGEYAVAILNRGNTEQNIAIDFGDLGINNVCSARDLWAHTDFPIINNKYETVLQPHAVSVIRFEGISAANLSYTLVSSIEKSENTEINLSDIGYFDWKAFAANEKAKADYIISDHATQTYDSSYRFFWTNGEDKALTETGKGIPSKDYSIHLKLSNKKTIVRLFFTSKTDFTVFTKSDAVQNKCTYKCDSKQVLYEYKLLAENLSQVDLSFAGDAILYAIASGIEQYAGGKFIQSESLPCYDLSAIGSFDWHYFGEKADMRKNGRGMISLSSTGNSYLESDSSYEWSNGKESEKGNCRSILQTSSYELSVLSDSSARKLTLVTGTADGSPMVLKAYNGGMLFAEYSLSGKLNTVELNYFTLSESEIKVTCKSENGESVMLAFAAIAKEPENANVSYAVTGCHNATYVSDDYSVNDNGNRYLQFYGVPSLTAYDIYLQGSNTDLTYSVSGGNFDVVNFSENDAKKIRIYHNSTSKLTVTLYGNNAEITAVRKIANPVFLKTSGVSYADGNYIINYEYMGPDNAVLHTAVYNLDGAVKTIKTDTVTSGPGSLTISSDDKSPIVVRQFIWSKSNVPMTDPTEYKYQPDDYFAYVENAMIGTFTAKSEYAKGAVLLDVRSKEEFEKDHIDGSINIPHNKITSESLPFGKDDYIIVYCSSSKRSIQAFASLNEMGYSNVHVLGSMNNWYNDISFGFDSKMSDLLVEGSSVSVKYSESKYDNLSVSIALEGKEYEYDTFKMPKVSNCDVQLTATLICNGLAVKSVTKDFLFYDKSLINIYASDLPFIQSTAGWGSVKRNYSVENNPMRVCGIKFDKGIGTHANSTVEFSIPDHAKRFITFAGYDEEVGTGASGCKCVLTVRIDGRDIETSGILVCGTSHLFDIEIPDGAKTITLLADMSYDNNYSDHIDFAIAGFVN